MAIRVEKKEDYQSVEPLVKAAFTNRPFSDGNEHELVKRLRRSDEFIPELSLVYEEDNQIAGHILLTKIKIGDHSRTDQFLALAPVSVWPSCQNKGIGKALIQQALKKAKDLDYQAVIVLGHEQYYPRFGFEPASKWSIKAPFEVNDVNFMALELVPGSLSEVQGTVVYSPAFFA
ncbi:GNAT family N-acetyltransferase [Bacillus sp. 1P06AnD]|uniref:GNAT family N-acetyltransferase n=1 Tax=Bacillus sp. 1P06AnD TaxID=3132208 RepID=UPI0039A331F4